MTNLSNDIMFSDPEQFIAIVRAEVQDIHNIVFDLDDPVFSEPASIPNFLNSLHRSNSTLLSIERRLAVWRSEASELAAQQKLACDEKIEGTLATPSTSIRDDWWKERESRANLSAFNERRAYVRTQSIVDACDVILKQIGAAKQHFSQLHQSATAVLRYYQSIS